MSDQRIRSRRKNRAISETIQVMLRSPQTKKIPNRFYREFIKNTRQKVSRI